MVFLTPHQQFVLKALPTEEEPEKQLKIIEFYINFGFCHRNTAEAALKKAITKLSTSNEATNDQKEYIKEVYIENDFEEVFNTEELNKYWDVTDRKTGDDLVLKRKERAVVNKLVIPERSPKERRIAENTSRNRIYDLSNAGPSGQSTLAFQQIRNSTSTNQTPLPELSEVVTNIIKSNFQKDVHLNNKYYNLLKKIVQGNLKEEYIFQILAHILEAHRLSPNLFIVAKLPIFSEMDINLLFWGRIINLLFSNSPTIIVKTGEKKLESSTFKIDYKIGCVFKDEFMTLSYIEIGKFVDNTKVFDDHYKLLLEGKVIVNNIVKRFPFVHPKSTPIITLQICGLKGNFVEINLVNQKEYVAHRPLNRLRASLITCNDSHLLRTFPRQLLYYKEHLQNLHFDIKQMVNKNDDKRASFGRTLGDNTFTPPNYLDYIDDKVQQL